jgi:hypothetical protein
MGVTFSIRFILIKVLFKLPYSPGKYNPVKCGIRNVECGMGADHSEFGIPHSEF